MTPLKLNREEQTRLFAAIGRIVVEFQQMESWLAESLTGLLALDPMGDRHTVLASMSFRQKVDLLFVLYGRKRRHDLKTPMETVRKALHKAEEYRNRIVHSVWAVGGTPRTWIREKSSLRGKKGLGVTSRAVDIAHLEKSADSLRTITQWELATEQELTAAIQHLQADDENE